MKSHLFAYPPLEAYEIEAREKRCASIPAFSNKPPSGCSQKEYWEWHNTLYLGGSSTSKEWLERSRQAKIRDGWRCKRCGSPENLETDHIIELSKGGSNDFSNLQTLCHDCHEKKSKRKFRSLS